MVTFADSGHKKRSYPTETRSTSSDQHFAKPKKQKSDRGEFLELGKNPVPTDEVRRERPAGQNLSTRKPLPRQIPSDSTSLAQASSAGSPERKTGTIARQDSGAQPSSKKFNYIDDQTMKFPALPDQRREPMRISSKRGPRAPVRPRRQVPEEQEEDTEMSNLSTDSDSNATYATREFDRPRASFRTAGQPNTERLQRSDSFHGRVHEQNDEDLIDDRHDVPGDLLLPSEAQETFSNPAGEGLVEEEGNGYEAPRIAQQEEKQRARPFEPIDSFDELVTMGQLLMSKADLPYDNQQDPQPPHDGHEEEEIEEEQRMQPDNIEEQHVPKEAAEMRPDCQCGNCILPPQAKRDHYDFQVRLSLSALSLAVTIMATE